MKSFSSKWIIGSVTEGDMRLKEASTELTQVGKVIEGDGFVSLLDVVYAYNICPFGQCDGVEGCGRV